MFVLSQDRLNMDLDRDCLELMLNLLESDVSYQQALDVCGLTSAQLEKNKQKVRELCEEIQSQGHAIHLNLDNITVSSFLFMNFFTEESVDYQEKSSAGTTKIDDGPTEIFCTFSVFKILLSWPIFYESAEMI